MLHTINTRSEKKSIQKEIQEFLEDSAVSQQDKDKIVLLSQQFQAESDTKNLWALYDKIDDIMYGESIL